MKKVADYIYRMYTKGQFICLELEHGYAVRAEEALLKRNLSLLSEPLAAPYRRPPYIYSGEEVGQVCCRLGITPLVKRVISLMERLLAGGQIQKMLSRVTSKPEEQDELLMRIAFTIDRCNLCFLKGDLGMLRNEDLHLKLLEAGILGFVHMMLEE